eukprot:TRINITY_DN27626_c0_g1_i1.p1 TRINITY_DN27626_c0_g1~~TRINITY_DN27626_c0_g1_i1.p1  ORF type:complete len:273 (-),score=45.48 TRINITY_DN27626_c0_g1_i1:354-1118(-)
MIPKGAPRLLEKIRTCKETSILKKSLLVDYVTGSDFQILEWAGDRHLKSLMAEIAMQTSRGLMDQGDLSKLCDACESNDALARVFDLAGFARLVDEGSGSTSQVGEADKRKADVVEAIVAELCQKRAANTVANEALEMLVAFIYESGRSRCCNVKSNGVGEDRAPAVYPPLQQRLDKNSVSKLYEWAKSKEHKEKKKDVQFVQTQQTDAAGNIAWHVSVQLDGSSLDGAYGEGPDVQSAKKIAADKACQLLGIP